MANKITEIKERVLQIAKYHGVSYEKFSNEECLMRVSKERRNLRH